MALLPILEYPDPRLKTVAGPVTRCDDRLRRHVADMAETMYEAPGVGLAATQVDVHERLLVIDVSENTTPSRSSTTAHCAPRAGSWPIRRRSPGR